MYSNIVYAYAFHSEKNDFLGYLHSLIYIASPWFIIFVISLVNWLINQ